MSTEDENRLKRQKEKLLKKYLVANQSQNFNSNKSYIGSGSFLVKDYDEAADKSDFQDQISSQQSGSQERITKRRRIQSSDEDQNNKEKIKQKILVQHRLNKQTEKDQNSNILQSKKLRKKFKKAFGIQDDEQLQNFMKQMKIQGMDIKQIKKILKSKKAQIKVESFQQTQKGQKQKKKAKKQKKRAKKDQKIKQESQKVKFQDNLLDSDSSDIEIPDYARTIYRNKDGTIKTQTEAEKKQKKKQQVQSRLAEWQKGMKKEDSDRQDNQDIAYAKNEVWDDPLKIWNEQNLIKPFECKYPGPGNRFNIKPGHRWDGVVRGNGFENRLIQEQNLRRAKEARQQKEYLKNL